MHTTSFLAVRTLVQFSLTAVVLLTLISAANAQGTKPTVYKIAEAGVQLDLPSGWEAGKVPNGTIAISKKDSGGYVVFSVSVLPREPSLTIDTLFEAFSEGIYESAGKIGEVSSRARWLRTIRMVWQSARKRSMGRWRVSAANWKV
jgi:hypothetical protein